MTVAELLVTHPIAQQWTPATRALYTTFSALLMHDEPLLVKIGKGGLSYSKPTPTGDVFVLHFNAAPRGNDEALAFADFRKDALQSRLDLEVTLHTLQKALAASSLIKCGKVWCSLHFPLAKAPHVARVFAEHLIAKIQ